MGSVSAASNPTPALPHRGRSCPADGLQGEQRFFFEEGGGAVAGLRVVEAGVAEGAQECDAAFAHFALPGFERALEGGVVAGACGFAHVAGVALHGEVFGAQGVFAEGVDGPGCYERTHGFDEGRRRGIRGCA